MIATPANWIIGMPARIPIAMHEPIGVCSFGCTFESTPDAGSLSSRDIPKQSRIVAVWIARQQTKIAADTTRRNTVANPLLKFASMIWAGPNPPAIAAFRFGIASRHA